MALTRRQKEVLEFIARFQDENHYSPSYEEIAHGLKLSSLATVHKHITSLEGRQYLKRTYNQSRSVEITPKFFQEQRRYSDSRKIEVPLAGRIAAGRPVDAAQTPDTLDFTDFAGDRDTYALEVNGDSMIDDHILSGDYVLVERTAEVQDGEIAVALVRGSETTLKRVYREADGMVRLQPANAGMSPIREPAADVQVQGRVLAVLRKYR
ncbi:MAG: transcriptional repressor LexA [Bryobacteraceae bacterium]